MSAVGRLRRVPFDLWLEPLVIVTGSIAFVIWHANATFSETEAPQLQWSTLGKTIARHTELTVLATLIVLVIAIPLGILVTRPGLTAIAPIIVNIANIGQAAPALGVVVLFLMWWQHTPFLAAIAALVVYAVLPILQNTITGLRGVDQKTVEAARGIGFSNGRTLVQVELPLALPVILNGVRTALVLLVGTATLGTFIGAGGLGVLITTGTTLFLPKVLAAGAVLVALLAVAIDWLARLVEYFFTPRGLRAEGAIA
ncbi:ABC transporter permease [Tsukamurella sp. 8F]|uniref:ABC transporter permease n=1 Tax=unclassified Tsukamurella TaxID=2633480 RepID=UPI0023B93549|nr:MULTISPECIES: ABC transporter permease [unclassified Tsukamurella]MDF0530357.1 ABC transporter permease [Tsukamurella sp. 8J]MDF0587654.1 ABC transporter permease [Tsukamurella sp. 8F]